MPFIDEILKYKSLSIVGLEKNTGKTVCLNYVLGRLPVDKRRICVTSIGIDGESVDSVTGTSKPRIFLRDGVLFSTSEEHYRSRRLVSEILDIFQDNTSLGRVVTAKVISSGNVLLSGPSSAASLKRWMDSLQRFDVDLAIVDGALSRMSSASPAVSQAMILSTGAAFSANIGTLVQKTAFIVEMIQLPMASSTENVSEISALGGDDFNVSPGCKAIKIKGALTDGALKKISGDRRMREIPIVVKDFTRIFATPQTYHSFVRSGGKLTVERRCKLLAVCVNPFAPNGYVLDSDVICHELSKVIDVPIYDIVKHGYET